MASRMNRLLPARVGGGDVRALARDDGRLSTGGDYDMMLSGLGNLERQNFDVTGELAVGLDAVGVFEDAVRVAPDDADRAASEHNVAMAINSLLIKYPEDGLEEVSGRPHLRQDAIDAASRALHLYHAATASGAAFLTRGPAITAAQQAGRCTTFSAI